MKRNTLFPIALAVAVLSHLAFSTVGAANCGLSIEEQQVLLDMMFIGIVIETVQEDQGNYPKSRGVFVRLDSVLELRSPPYEDRFQEKDPWGNRYIYWSDGLEYAVFSPGFDGRLDFDYLEIESHGWADMRGDDVIISIDGWVKRPMTQRDRQKRTMADMRSIATAIEEYSIDNNFYPSAWSIEELEPYVAPYYFRTPPGRDGWGNDLIVQSTPEEYVLLSTGRDGLLDESQVGGATNTYDSDIVFSNGSFVQWPEGKQHCRM
jgi:general secretion pathway protein G